MSAALVKSAAAQDKFEDVITCCICSEIYKDPKILPCVHTFCMTCLQHAGTQSNKRPGDSMPCPLCRRVFKVPQKGFPALQKNFLMAQLIEIADNRDRAAASLCDKHEDENLCLYCSDCNEVLCLACLRECHQNHRLSDVDTAADVLRSQLQGDISTAKRCKSDALKTKEKIAQTKSAIVEKIEGFEEEVCQVRLNLRVLINRHADSLLHSLSSLKKKGIENIEIEEEEIDKHLASLESFENCCAELTSTHQNDRLIFTMANKLKQQIVELERLNKSVVERQQSSFEISFTKTIPVSLEAYRNADSGNLIGEVKAILNYSPNSKLVRTFRTNTTAEIDDIISGMTLCDNKVFIVNNDKPVYVNIYDSGELNCTTKWAVQRFVSEVDLKYCVSENGIIYIANGISREILRIDRDLILINFLTQDDWGRLSVSKDSTIVATCYKRQALREYSLQGALLREIELCFGIVHPLHALKLSNSEFIVSHGDYKDDLHRVCIVNYFGDIVKSFGDFRGDSIKQLDVPTSLAVQEDGNILVLDKNNSRVLLLSSALEFKKELFTKANGLRKPAAMHLDRKTGRLYIADNTRGKCEWNDGKVLVFSVK